MPPTRLADILGSDRTYHAPGVCTVFLLPSGELKVEIDGLLKLHVLEARHLFLEDLRKDHLSAQ